MDFRETSLSTVGVTDPAEIARIREERFKLRQARILSDPHLDPRMQAWLLDREIWTVRRTAEETGWSEAYIWALRRATAEHEGWHVSAFPDLDNEAGTADSGAEAGRVREWTEWRGSHDTNPETGKLAKRPATRHGRARADRSTRNKPGYQLGTPRADKKGTGFGPRRKYTEEHLQKIVDLAAEGLRDEQIAERMNELFPDPDVVFDAGKVQRLRWKHGKAS